MVLSVRGISKCYEIYDKPVKRLWQMLCAGKKRFYREFWALKDVSFDIRRGESVGIIGRNGAGKSTILQIITGTLRPTSGEIVKKPGLRVAALLELGSGFNPEFTGRENVYLNASILGLSRAETQRRYKEIIDFADIGDFIDQPVKKYSSGMKVRLAFAVQIMVDPDILIVDEALAVGDMFFQQKCMHYMRKLQEKGTTLLFVSHALGTVRSLCRKAVFLKQGRMVACGDAAEVCDMYVRYWNESTQKANVAKKEEKPSAAKPVPAVQTGAQKGGIQLRVASPEAKKLFMVDPKLKSRISQRMSTGELELTGLALYDAKGNPAITAAKGDVLNLVVSMKVHKHVPAGAVFAVSINTKFTQGLLVLNSLQCGKTLPELLPGQEYVIQTRFVSPFYQGRFIMNFSLKPYQDREIYYEHVFGGVCYDAVMGEADRALCVAGMVGLDASEMLIENVK